MHQLSNATTKSISAIRSLHKKKEAEDSGLLAMSRTYKTTFTLPSQGFYHAQREPQAKPPECYHFQQVSITLHFALTPHNTLHFHQRYSTQGLRARASIIVSLTTRNE